MVLSRGCGQSSIQLNRGRDARVPPADMLDGVALPNLTRDQAAERAAAVTVDNYKIALDLTDGSGGPGASTFRSLTTVTFDALPGTDTVIDIAADNVRSAALNGVEIDVSA